jgi:TPR repeat protein
LLEEGKRQFRLMQYKEARPKLAEAAKAMNAEAMAYYGWVIELLGGSGSEEEAEVLYQQSSKLGDPLGRLRLGLILRDRAGEVTLEAAREIESAAKEWLNNGDKYPDADLLLGSLYEQGLGVQKDPNAGFARHQKAANAGDNLAKTLLADRYRDAQGVGEKNAVESMGERVFRMRRAQALYRDAQKTQPEAKTGYGVMLGDPDLGNDRSGAIKQYEEGAYAGDPAAMLLLADSDPAQSEYWRKEAITAGDLDTVYALGRSLESAGSPQSLVKAAEQYRQVITFGRHDRYSVFWLRTPQSLLSSMLQLAKMYEAGRGVAQDYERALGYYRRIAAAGNAWAINQIGLFYLEGYGVHRDCQEARRWFQIASSKGLSEAAFNLGAQYESGCDDIPDFQKAKTAYETAATMDPPSIGAMYQLTFLYAVGRGTEPSEAEATRWCEKATASAVHDYAREFALKMRPARVGNACAMNQVGLSYLYARGTPQNCAESQRWFQDAERKDFTESSTSLGLWYEGGCAGKKDLKTAFQYYLKAAESIRPSVEGMYRISLLYANGQGVPADDRAARKWLEAAAAKAHKPAQVALGAFLTIPRGGPQDCSRARKLLLEAGSTPGASTNLGLLFEAGCGVILRDPDYALMMIKQDKDRYYPAYCALGDYYSRPDNPGSDTDTAIRYYELGVKQEIGQCMLRLGDSYLQTRGNRQVLRKQAIDLYKRALDSSTLEANTKLGSLYKSEGDYAKAENYLQNGVDAGSVNSMLALAELYISAPSPYRDYSKARPLLERVKKESWSEAAKDRATRLLKLTAGLVAPQ